MNEYFLISPYDKNKRISDNIDHGKWRTSFGEIFCVTAFILAKHRNYPNESNYSVAICCTGFDTEGKENEIRQLYTYFKNIFISNKITNARILLDHKAQHVLGNLVAKECTSFGELRYYPRQYFFSKVGFLYCFQTDEYNRPSVIYHPNNKNDTAGLLHLANGSFDFSIEMAIPLNNMEKQLNDYIARQIKDFSNQSQAAILVLRKRQDLVGYEQNRKDFEVSTLEYLSQIIETILEVNKKANDSQKIKSLFLLGDNPNDNEFFKIEGHANSVSPLAFLQSKLQSNGEIKIYTFTEYRSLGENIFGDQNLQFLAQAYFIQKLKEAYNVKLAIGPNSGGTHMLAVFGLPVFFPCNPYMGKSSRRYLQKRGDVRYSNCFYRPIDVRYGFKDQLKKDLCEIAGISYTPSFSITFKR
jgi:hypothetical protein